MSTFVEPGTRLAGRFRLEDRVSESSGSTLWKAIDEVLARPVAVRTFAEGFPRVNEVVTAARAASRLTDPRLTQVFDAADDDGQAYVVSEWVTGDTLVDLLESGPLEPQRAAALIAEAAEALASAHQAGLPHLSLTPGCLLWTSGGTVKLLGLGVEAALTGAASDDPGREDAEGLGRLLYAALTGHWPGDEETGLPPAPAVDGKLCTPRQVRAGVPGNLDVIAGRALRVRSPALSTPADVADALADIPRPAPVPFAVTATPAVDNTQPQNGEREQSRPAPSPRQPAAPPRQPRPAVQSNMISRSLVAVVVVLLMVAIGIGAWTVGRNIGSTPPVRQQVPPGAGKATPSSAPVVLKPAGAEGYDPLGDDKDENTRYAPLAIDGKAGTEWHTSSYRDDPAFGRLKKGAGLLIDMGKNVSISSVDVTLGGASDIELKVGDSKDYGSMDTVAQGKNASGKTTLTPEKEATGRYVVIWFTKLPTDGGGFRGTIYEVVVHGAGTA
ncbi:protein kinase family protein [Bailinhaonella thermotolerans]|uniref:Serine/threonine protein kinase n=1 Tax=Bailinhaonella thermotolerans TaxID=1070861 RepID=A0A3A4B444_9ACTN|nr:protein kinase family protein [Bailinhaonella thermotolerans]RJL32140.1 serine/threonine protein kinase [Bailinhaonella thermotolerans]